MGLRKGIIIGSVIISLVLYNVLKFKVGPCSPEMEMLINSK